MGSLPQWFSAFTDAASELSVVGSYSRLGYDRRKKLFNLSEIPSDLKGRVFIITGANSGIGLATATQLAHCKAKVIFVCRNHQKASAAIQQMMRELPDGAHTPELVLADLSDLQSVQEAAITLSLQHEQIHGLIHNAGTGIHTRTVNQQGIESMFCTHVLGPLALTEALLPQLRASGTHQNPSRVIWVSSGGMYTSGLNLEDLQWNARRYEWLKVYAENKRAQVVMAEAYASLEGSPAPVVFHSMHPGWVKTPLVHSHLPKFEQAVGRLLRTPDQGADTIVWLAASEAAGHSSGAFWLDRKKRRKVVLPGTRVSHDDGQKLLELCKKLIL